MGKVEQKEVVAGKDNGFMYHNFMEELSAGDGKAEYKLTIRPESRNGYGFVHGGALYALADNAAGAAAHSDGRYHVTQNGDMHFLRNQMEGDIFARATVTHRGRTTSLVQVDLVGQAGDLLASGFFTYFCIGGEEPEQKK